MIDYPAADYMIQNGFAIGVAIFLLYKDAKFNDKVAETLQKVVLELREMYPDYKLIVHPECNLDVCKNADLICSTGQMIDFVKENDKVIIGTEIGLYDQLKFRFPYKKLVPLSSKMTCDDMKKTTLLGAVKSLYFEQNEVEVPDEIRNKSMKSLQRMFEIV